MSRARSLRHAFAFTLLATSAILFGTSGGLAGIFLVWSGTAFLAIAVGYAFPDHVFIFHKTNGRVPVVRKVLLWPFFVLLYSIWHILRTLLSEAPFAELSPGLWIGRRLLPNEYPPVRTLVDLTAEFDEHVPNGAKLLAFPILDGAPTSPERLRNIAQSIAACESPVYLHCAQGHGRTSMVAAAVLMERGLARNIPEALTMITNVRRGAKPNTNQRAALEIAYSRRNEIESK